MGSYLSSRSIATLLKHAGVNNTLLNLLSQLQENPKPLAEVEGELEEEFTPLIDEVFHSTVSVNKEKALFNIFSRFKLVPDQVTKHLYTSYIKVIQNLANCDHTHLHKTCKLHFFLHFVRKKLENKQLCNICKQFEPRSISNSSCVIVQLCSSETKCCW